MKKLFIALAFMFFSSFAFANNITEKHKNVIKIEVNGNSEIVMINNQFIIDLQSIESYTKLSSVINDDCSGVKVSFDDGTSLTWKGSCTKLWRLVNAYLNAQ